MSCDICFKHFLIVPFNANNKSQEWLNHRLRFFRKFTKPSIVNQTSKYFFPVFLIDPTTPPGIKMELKNMGGLLHETESMWAVIREDDSSFDSELSEFIKSYCGDVDWVVTSRVDSDDAISKRYIATTQSLLREKEEFIIYPSGIMWVNNHCFVKETVSPPFGTLVEPVSDEIKTVFYVSHGLIPKLHPHQIVPDFNMWIHVYHGRNLSTNAKRLGRELELEEVQENFPWLK